MSGRISRWERHEFTPAAYEGAGDFDRFSKWLSLRRKATRNPDIPGYASLAAALLHDYWVREELTSEEYVELQAQRNKPKVDPAWAAIVARASAKEAEELEALTALVEKTGL